MHFSVSESSFLDTAAILLFQEISLSGCVLRLRESVNSLIVIGIVFLCFSCDVFNALSPGVLRHTKVTITFNIDVVDASDNLKEAIHSPVGAP